MPTRVETYAHVRPVPYLFERGVSQDVTFVVRYGGSARTPDSGRVTIVRPDGTNMVDNQAVTPGSTSSYTFTPASSEALGAGYDVRFTPVFGGVTYPTYRTSAFLCEYVPPCVIDAQALYTRIPELQHRVPQAQGSSGDGTGWQPQIDEAYYALLQRLIDQPHKPFWRIREVTGYREWLLVRALQMAVGALNGGPESGWAQKAKELAFEMRAVEARFAINYSDDSPNVRRGGSSAVRLAPNRGCS